MNFLLLQVGGPIEFRYKESEERGPALEQLVYCIRSFREAALSSDQKFDHIDIAEKQKVFASMPKRG
jgi:heat shock protein 4